MTNTAKNKSRLICFILVLALLLAYTPGLADTAYADAEQTVVLTLDTNVHDVTTQIATNNLTSEVSFESGAEANTYKLTLTNADLPNLQIESYLPGQNKLEVYLDGDTTIGAFKSGCEGNRSNDVTFKSVNSNTQTLNTDSIDIFYDGDAKLYFTDVNVNADALNITTGALSGGHGSVEVYAQGSEMNVSELHATVPNMIKLSNHDTKGGSYNFEDITFSGGLLCIEHADVAVDALTATATEEDKGFVRVNGGNLDVTGHLTANALQLARGEGSIAGSLENVGCIEYYSAGNRVHTKAAGLSDAIL
ncbi:MAG: hypothetical protein K6F52_08240, partial [Clostridia bacterium]|nr:hypothetical protein [Clostridia bacterium]